ncbi:MAG: VOC family protein [Pseudomonadota bacterium]|nr:VOC family protein [Pseudomonadota bacterium]
MTDVREDPAATATSRSDTHGKFVWYELLTPDTDGAKAFYDAVVGWDIGEPAPEFDGYRMIGSEGGFAGGVNPHDHFPGPRWMGYIAVDDVDSAVTSIEKGGGRLLKEAWDIPNVGRVAMAADPQGAPFYVIKPSPPAGQENAPNDVFSPDKPGRCAWNELSTSDPVAARRFYGEQFDWESGDFMDMGEHGEYRFFDHRGVRLGAVAGTMDGQPPHWRHYFRVPSIAKAKETAEANGGKIAMGPMEVPGGDHIIIGFDPQGAEFALVGGK